MSESERGNPIHVAVVVLLMVGGGWYFLSNYEIDGLDEISVYPKEVVAEKNESLVSFQQRPAIGELDPPILERSRAELENPFSLARRKLAVATDPPPVELRSFENLRIAAWALDAFGPTKLANPLARRNLARVVRRFDIVAVQQVASIERDLIPRLVESINEGQNRYDYVMGDPVGPKDRPEQMAFIFDKTKVLVDRRHTYTLDDPDDQFAFDPLVGWFRAAAPPVAQAWTFTLVNIRVDLARAPDEVAVLPEVVSRIRSDGRGEDDIVLAGLFQADDAYLLPTLAKPTFKAAVRSLPTDLFGRYQTSNVLIDSSPTSEYLGRGGVYDFSAMLELTLAEAETVTSQLPVYAEFTAVEGGL